MTRLLKENKWPLYHLFFYFFIVTLFIFSSCSKPPGKIGSEIQPEQSKLDVSYIYTTEVFAYSMPEDSVRTDEMAISLLGSVMDPVFGSSVAGIYTQYKLSEASPKFGTNPVMDSLVVQLLYSGNMYGDTLSPLIVHVYELMEPLDFFAEYYSNTSIPVASTDYGNVEFVPRPHDSIAIDGDTLAPMLRINLSNKNTDLAYKLLNADSLDLESDSSFTEFFKGLYFVTEPVNEKGSINYFNLLTGGENSSKLILYYHNDYGDSIGDPVIFTYIVDPITPRFNKFEHDFSQAESDFKAQVINRDTSLGLQKFYVQGIAGVKSVINIPDLRKTNDLDVVAINEAKLVLSGFEEDPFNGAPHQLGLIEVQEDGSLISLLDELEGDNFFDGYYNSSTNSYSFRVTRHIQSLISDTTRPNNKLYLFVRGESIRPQRFVFKGNQPADADTATAFRLEILYTILN